MNLSQLVSRLVGKKQARDLAAAESFEVLAEQVESGDLSNDESILDALAEFGKTPQELAQEIAKRVERRRLLAILDEGPDLRAEQAALIAEQSEEMAILEIANKRWRAFEEQYGIRRGNNVAKLSALRIAEGKLRQLLPAARAARERELSELISRASRRLMEAERFLGIGGIGTIYFSPGSTAQKTNLRGLKAEVLRAKAEADADGRRASAGAVKASEEAPARLAHLERVEQRAKAEHAEAKADLAALNAEYQSLAAAVA